MDFVKDGKAWELNVVYIYQKEPKGLGDAVNCINSEIEYYEDFLLVLGDNVVIPYESILELLKFHTSKNAIATLLTDKVRDPTRHGVLKIERKKIIDIVEKPEGKSVLNEFKNEDGTFNLVAGPMFLTEIFLNFLKISKLEKW